MAVVASSAATTSTQAGLDTANLQIDEIISHRVFARDASKVARDPVLTDKLMRIPREGLDALQQRLTTALGSRSHGIEMSIEKTDAESFFQVAADAISQGKDHFIEATRTMARKLAAAQANTNGLSGVLIVLRGRIGRQPCRFLAVIKAEVHDGFGAGDTDDAVSMDYLKSLMLTPTQRLYKVGLLMELKAGPAAKVGSYVSTGYRAFLFDHLITATETRSAAAYFYAHFLGMDIQKSSKKLTQDFFEHSETFIKTSSLSDDEKWELREALRVDLRSGSAIINASEFATNHIQDETVRQSYCDYLDSRGFPKTAVAKDVAYVKSRLRRPRRWDFSNGVKLLIPADADPEVVKVTKQTETETTVVIGGSFKETD